MPGQKYCVYGNTQALDKSAGFHRFPQKNLEQRKVWLAIFNMTEDVMTQSTRVCSRHFPSGDSDQMPGLPLGKLVPLACIYKYHNFAQYCFYYR